MLAVPFWLMSYVGVLVLPAGFDGLLWHQHEMLFGFAGAAIAGFILTAIPNWTGRLPVSGWRLGLLVSFWLAGRLGFLAAAIKNGRKPCRRIVEPASAFCCCIARSIALIFIVNSNGNGAGAAVS